LALNDEQFLIWIDLSSTGLDAMTTLNAVIVGTGQAVLGASYFLQQNMLMRFQNKWLIEVSNQVRTIKIAQKSENQRFDCTKSN
jgi:hypothetical protein